MAKDTKNKKSKQEEEVPVVNGIGQGMGLLGGMLSSNIQNPESELPPLPSTAGTTATPINTTTGTGYNPATATLSQNIAHLAGVTPNTNIQSPAVSGIQPTFSPTTSYKNSASFNQSESIPVIMNAEAMAKAEAQQLEENKKADEYNATLTSRVENLNNNISLPKSTYDRYGRVIKSVYTPIAPLPIIPKEIEVPNMVVANHSKSYGESKSEGTSGHKPPEPDLLIYSLVADEKGNLMRTTQKPEDASSPLTFQDNYGNARVDLANGIYAFAKDLFPESEENLNGYKIEVPANVWDGSKFVPNPKQPKMEIALTGNVPKDMARLTKILVAEEMKGKDFRNGWLNPQVGANPGGMTIHAANMQGKFGEAYATVWATARDKAADILGLKRTGVVPNSYMDIALSKNTEYQNSRKHSKKQRWNTQQRNEVIKMITGTLKAEGLGQM